MFDIAVISGHDIEAYLYWSINLPLNLRVQIMQLKIRISWITTLYPILKVLFAFDINHITLSIEVLYRMPHQI